MYTFNKLVLPKHFPLRFLCLNNTKILSPNVRQTKALNLLMARTISALFVVLLILVSMFAFLSGNEKSRKISELRSISSSEACTDVGGSYKAVCESGNQMCVKEFGDSGKPCISSMQCEGECRLPWSTDKSVFVMGQCQNNNNPCGCWNSVEFGMVVSGICID